LQAAPIGGAQKDKMISKNKNAAISPVKMILALYKHHENKVITVWLSLLLQKSPCISLKMHHRSPL